MLTNEEFAKGLLIVIGIILVSSAVVSGIGIAVARWLFGVS